MRKFIHTLTVTGADNNTKVEDIFNLQIEFPFLEFGLLLDKKSQDKGSKRYPSTEWICDLVEGFEHRRYPPRLSGHICGSWIKDICKGNWSILDERTMMAVPPQYFERLQLNFNCYIEKITIDKFIKGLQNRSLLSRVRTIERLRTAQPIQFIFQFKENSEKSNAILADAVKANLNVVPFFDSSGGRGNSPETWENGQGNCGYAGGLGPDNVIEQLCLIEQVCGSGPIWIDSETLVRNDKDEFDPEIVAKLARLVKPFVL